MSLPYVVYDNISEFLEEILQYCDGDSTDIDGSVVRATKRPVEKGSMYDEQMYDFEAGFRALDDFFVFKIRCNGDDCHVVYGQITSVASRFGLKVLGGRFQL